MINPVILQAYYTFILFIFSMFLWTFRHRGSYPILSKEENYQVMCFLMHVCNIPRIVDLKEWGVHKNTIKAYYAKEMRNYKAAHPEISKERRHWSPEALERSKKAREERGRVLREERLQREKQREEVNLRSWKKLDEAIRERYECAKSVTDWFYHRGEKRG